MLSRLLRHLSLALSDATFALGMGLKGALRPAMFFRSAIVSMAATGLTLWLFRYHWNIAQYFVMAFVPMLMASLGTFQATALANQAASPATTLSMFDPVGGMPSVVHGLSAGAHAVLALAIAVVCAFILCGLLLSLIGICYFLLPSARQRTLDKQPMLRPAAAIPIEAWWMKPARFALRLLGFLLISQLIYLGAMLVPHVGILWLLFLAYLPANFLAYRALQDLASRKECVSTIRQCRSGLFLFGLLFMFMAFIPLLNLLAPAVLAIGTTRLGYRTLAAQRAKSSTL